MERQIIEHIAKQQHEKNLELRQRKSTTHDFGGVEFHRQGGKDNPAEFRISVSEDLQYFLGWRFKIILENFTTTTSSSTQPVSLDIQPTTQNIPSFGSYTHDHDITPNPHTHAVTGGITQVASIPENLEIWIEGFNLTPYFVAQFPGQWPTQTGYASGIYPDDELMNQYDIIQAACDYGGAARDIILSSGYKKIEFKVNPSNPDNPALFAITFVNYLQYSHLNR